VRGRSRGRDALVGSVSPGLWRELFAGGAGPRLAVRLTGHSLLLSNAGGKPVAFGKHRVGERNTRGEGDAGAGAAASPAVPGCGVSRFSPSLSLFLPFSSKSTPRDPATAWQCRRFCRGTALTDSNPPTPTCSTRSTCRPPSRCRTARSPPRTRDPARCSCETPSSKWSSTGSQSGPPPTEPSSTVT